MTTKTYMVADLFCGAGGTSTGAMKAIEEIGAKLDLVAINHWATAIETHAANHPTARHLVEDVSVVDPESVVEDGHLDLLMASPECRFYSRARGGKPIKDQGRMNPWAVHNWLTRLDVDRVLIENVPEFTAWGPLDPDGRPYKAQKGKHFEAWFLTFGALGYAAEWRMLNAADYGDATSRTRFFLLARKDGRPIVWPEPTHAKADIPMFPGRKPWRGAREIIDWSMRGRSLLDDPKYRKKPLSPNTRRRIARGFQRFGGSLAPFYNRLLDLPEWEEDPETDAPEGLAIPFLVNRHGDNGSARVHSVDWDDEQGAAEPFVAANRNNNVPKAVDQPIAYVTTAPGGGSFLIEPGAKPFLLGQQSGGAPRSTDDPVQAVSQSGAISLVDASILEFYGTSHTRSVEDPLTTVTATARKHALVKPILVPYYSAATSGSDVDDPVPTITTKTRHALASPTLVDLNHSGPDAVDRKTPSLDEPLGTRNDMGVATAAAKPYLVPKVGERDGQKPHVHDIDDPLPAVTGHDAGALVEPVLKKLLESNVDPRRLIFVDGQPYLLDIQFRMLQNSELAKAMGFDDEESEYEFHGNIGEVTRQIGNAVPVGLAAALVRASLAPEGEVAEDRPLQAA